MLYNEVPVLLLTFNRPDITKILIDKLRLIKPQYIFIAQDGPRTPEEYKIITQVKECFNQIDRNCEIQTLFRDQNLGCYRAVTEWISRFFKQVDFWIILEDDCIPNQSFFELCAEIHNQRNNLPSNIGIISGSNFQTQSKTWDLALLSEHSPLLWWRATRKEKWEIFKQHKKIKSDFMSGKLTIREKWWFTKKAMKYYMLAGYWDNDRYLSCYFNKLLTVVPDKNHISNLWFVGVHNTRPWAYHSLQSFDTDYSKGIWNISISKNYNQSMLYFMKKMYIYRIIEELLKKIWLLSCVKKIVLQITNIFYSKKLKTYNE